MSASAREVRELLDLLGVAPQKRWGQNFLVNPHALERIVRAVDPAPAETVWEIGGGTGQLTAALLDRGARLVVFEIDHGLVGVLEELLRGHPGCALVVGDFVKTFAGVLERDGTPALVAGNLPYRSASRIIAELAASAASPRRLVFTVQKEMAERMAARPSTKAYSSFSVLCQARYGVRSAGDLGPGSFYPPPRVSSRVVVLEPRPGAPAAGELAALGRLSRLLFATRRKTIRRTLTASGLDPRSADVVRAALERLGIGTERRPEEVAVEQWVELGRLVAAAAVALPDAGGEELEDAELP